jgi:hypothetical protein
MINSARHFIAPRSRDDWRTLALGLAELSSDAMPAAEQAAFERLRDTAWDVASYAAVWHTVQLPSLGPGLLPGVVLGLLLIGQAISGRLTGGWTSLSNPFFLGPSLWLVGWFGLTLVVAAIRHGRAKGEVLQLAARLGLFASSATSA